MKESNRSHFSRDCCRDVFGSKIAWNLAGNRLRASSRPINLSQRTRLDRLKRWDIVIQQRPFRKDAKSHIRRNTNITNQPLNTYDTYDILRLFATFTSHVAYLAGLQRLSLWQVDGKVRSDMFYPAGFMDVIQIATCLRLSSLPASRAVDSGSHWSGSGFCLRRRPFFCVKGRGVSMLIYLESRFCWLVCNYVYLVCLPHIVEVSGLVAGGFRPVEPRRRPRRTSGSSTTPRAGQGKRLRQLGAWAISSHMSL